MTAKADRRVKREVAAVEGSVGALLDAMAAVAARAAAVGRVAEQMVAEQMVAVGVAPTVGRLVMVEVGWALVLRAVEVPAQREVAAVEGSAGALLDAMAAVAARAAAVGRVAEQMVAVGVALTEESVRAVSDVMELGSGRVEEVARKGGTALGALARVERRIQRVAGTGGPSTRRMRHYRRPTARLGRRV